MRTIATPGFRRQQPPTIWKFLTKMVFIFIFLVCGAVLFFLFQPEWTRLTDMRRHHSELEKSKEQAMIDQQRLIRQKKLLKTDPEYIENIARDKLDLMKPGETIYRLDNKPTAQKMPVKP